MPRKEKTLTMCQRKREKKNAHKLPSYASPPMQTAGAQLSFGRPGPLLPNLWEVNRAALGAIKQPLHIVSCTRPVFDLFNGEDGESLSLGGALPSLMRASGRHLMLLSGSCRQKKSRKKKIKHHRKRRMRHDCFHPRLGT